MENTEVIVGTYENLVLGFRVTKNIRQDTNPYTLETSFTDDAHRGALRCMSVSTNGILASSSTDDSVRLHSLRRRKEIGGLFEHNGTVNCIKFYEKSFMFSASEDGKICLWKTKNWEMLKVLKGHKSQVLYVTVHPSGKLALSVGSDKSLLTWDMLTGKLAFHRKIKDVAQQIHFTSDGDHYILVYQRSIQVCSIQDTQVIKEVELNWRINAFCHVKDDIYAVGGDDKHVYMLNARTGDKTLTLDMAKSEDQSFQGRIRCLSVVPSEDGGHFVFVGTSGGSIKGFTVNVTQGEEMSEELLSYEAGVRMTCMAVYRPAHTHGTETEELNGQITKSAAINGDGDDDGVKEDDDEDEGEQEEVEEEDKTLESYDEEDEETEPAPAKKRKKNPAVKKNQKLRSAQDRLSASHRENSSASGKKAKKKKGKLKGK